MAFRNIVIENPAHISVKNQNLVIHTDAPHTIPLEDISALLLESRQSTITTAALSQLGQCGCAVFVCDERHMPCAVLTPFQQHSRNLSVLRLQLEATEPCKKQLWRSIVQSKLRNQALCLDFCGFPEAAEELRTLSKRVRSGDSENAEATGAQLYFPALFGSGFTRSADVPINSGLNYGYAILRGAMARQLAVYGFVPSLGLHHRSTLNSLNLADDWMEPFRPVVDLLVFALMEEMEELTPAVKRQLFNCLNLDIVSDGKHYTVAYAMERLVQSLGKALENSESRLLLPQLQELKQHSYE
ncbi:MAG: type II CRISPR-associated endonuclease Cas1 [Oscillospiraceae bacterium]|nr:type II CRISPR-associated endonuclease Cas1 [Oscillospiraceae bacterium]